MCFTHFMWLPSFQTLFLPLKSFIPSVRMYGHLRQNKNNQLYQKKRELPLWEHLCPTMVSGTGGATPISETHSEVLVSKLRFLRSMLYQTPFPWQVLCIQNCWVHWDLFKKKWFASLGLMEAPLVFPCCFSLTESKMLHRAGLREHEGVSRNC